MFCCPLNSHSKVTNVIPFYIIEFAILLNFQAQALHPNFILSPKIFIFCLKVYPKASIALEVQFSIPEFESTGFPKDVFFFQNNWKIILGENIDPVAFQNKTVNNVAMQKLMDAWCLVAGSDLTHDDDETWSLCCISSQSPVAGDL